MKNHQGAAAYWVLLWLISVSMVFLLNFEEDRRQRATGIGAGLASAEEAGRWFEESLAALERGELRAAEIAAEYVALVGPRTRFGEERYYGLRDSLLGHCAWARCLRAEAEAQLLDADPTAYDRAIVRVMEAIGFFEDAAMRPSAPSWAERNVERALIKLEELRRKRAEAEAKRQSKKDKPPEPEPEQEAPPDEVEERDEEELQPTAQQDPGELSREQLQLLLERLAEAEREKRGLRQERQRLRSSEAERDW